MWVDLSGDQGGYIGLIKKKGGKIDGRGYMPCLVSRWGGIIWGNNEEKKEDADRREKAFPK